MKIAILFLGILAVNTEGKYPVSNAEWKTIYKNDLKADVRIAYNDFSRLLYDIDRYDYTSIVSVQIKDKTFKTCKIASIKTRI